MSSQEVDAITAQQIKTAQQFDQADRKNDTLVRSLKQACSRNKAIEKVALWKEREVQDHGSKSAISLKSNEGEVHSLAKIPDGALVTVNDVNKYEDERKHNASFKEDSQLNRFCDGQDTAWRPDTFFTEVCGQQEVPPWPIRPTELFTNPHLTFRIMALQMERRKAKKEAKKMQKLQEGGGAGGDGEDVDESQKKKKKKKKKEKGKKSKKEKKDKKKKKKGKGKEKEKDKKAKKEKREKETSAQEQAPSQVLELLPRKEVEAAAAAGKRPHSREGALPPKKRSPAAPPRAAEDLSKECLMESSSSEQANSDGESSEEDDERGEVASSSAADWEGSDA